MEQIKSEAVNQLINKQEKRPRIPHKYFGDSQDNRLLFLSDLEVVRKKTQSSQSEGIEKEEEYQRNIK